MGRVKRPEWQYVDQVKACKKGQWTCKCKFCGHTWDGGPARIRYHLLKIAGHGVGPCDQVLDAVKEVVTRLHADARGDGTDRNDYVNELVNAMGEEASQSVNDATASTHASDSSKIKKRKGYEGNLGSAFHLQARKHADQALRRFFYAEDIPEWKVRSPFFLEMVKAIGQAGPSYVPPSYHALHTTHLNDEVKCIKSDLMVVREKWKRHGCSIETVLKQNNDIEDLALQNQDLQHKMQLQDIKVQEQDKKIGMIEAQLESLNTATQTQLSTQDEKLKDMTSWAHVVGIEVTNTPTCTTRTNVTEHVIKNVDMAKHNDRTKRLMNIMLRGLPEPENETILTLNVNMSDFFGDHFGMQDVVVYGAHRVGKKKTEGHRAVVCTLLDARKRSIILENARF
ncbi:hypothetical protein L7F22_042976 [Adiantum nelumboides]|nr:hypothetical protein [Adiantum nelumboides]